MGVTIEAEKTLLFLDEIQECPNAITALRYLERYNRLAVIGAGSLIEFALNSPDLAVPVGGSSACFLNRYPSASFDGIRQRPVAELSSGNTTDSALMMPCIIS